MAAIRTSVKNVISLGLSTAMQIGQENGGMEKVTKSVANKLKSWINLSKEESQVMAQVLIGVAAMFATLGLGKSAATDASVASLKAAAATNQAASVGAKAAPSLASTISNFAAKFASSAKAKALMIGYGFLMAGGSAVGQGMSIHAQYKSGMTQADTTELQSMLKLIEEMIAETQEELEQILEQEQALISKMFSIINSKMETEREISNNLASMA